LPIAVGFGVKNAQTAGAIAAYADGVVVGSALIDTLKNSLDEKNGATPNTIGAVTKLVSEIADGVRQARKAAAE
jgi:tryptophan synthase alpha chain